MSQKENTTPVNIEGKLYISTDSSTKHESSDYAKGIFIYRFKNGDFTDIDERDIDGASFVISKATDSDQMDTIIKEMNQYKKANPDTQLRLGMALSYNGLEQLEPLGDGNTPSSNIEKYADYFNQTNSWNFRPIIHIGHEITQNETTAGLEFNVNAQLNYLNTQTKYRPIIHTSYKIADEYLIDRVFAKFPLWLTDVKTHDHHPTHLPGAWKHNDWSFVELHKYMETGIIEDYTPENGKQAERETIIYSTNRFHGTKTDLDHFTEGKSTRRIKDKRTYKFD